MIRMSDADEQWLTGPDAEPYLAEAAASTVDELSLLTRLRKTLSADKARLVVEQAALRRRAVTKFSRAAQMYFSSVGFEQATDEVTADYKAGRFPIDQPLLDLCCGIGGDLLSLALRGPTIGVDRSSLAISRAAANCELYAAIHGDKFRGSAKQGEAQTQFVTQCTAWHIDPDRRPAGKRTTRVELHEPSVEVLESMLAVNGNAAIKLAPAAELPTDWIARCEAEWVSRRGECKQLVAWFGTLAQNAGFRRATVLTDAAPQSLVGLPLVEVPSVATLDRFLYDPDAAVLAADLLGVLAQKYQIAAVHPGSVYLTGVSSELGGFAQTWEILDEMPFDVRRVRTWLAERRVGRLEIKKRGLDVDVEKLRRELQLTGDAALGLILVRRGDRVSAVLAQRANS